MQIELGQLKEKHKIESLDEWTEKSFIKVFP